MGVRVARSLSLFFLLAIVLSVLLRYTDSYYHFGIFKLFLVFLCSSISPVLAIQVSCFDIDIHIYIIEKAAVVICAVFLSSNNVYSSNY